jgi:quinol-cytochrome oxidoreductase complex cytochrome b subunit
MFVVLVFVIAVGYADQSISDDPANKRFVLVSAAIFAGSSIALAVLARLVWGRAWPFVVRGVLTVLLAYHALFGPAMMVFLIRDASSPEDPESDFIERGWPHVIAAINSPE